MDKQRSRANCGSANYHVADCTIYKQGMENLGYAPDEEDTSQMEEHEFYSGLFWEAVKNQNQPKHKLKLAAVQNTKNRQAENVLQNKEATSGELRTKT